MNFVCLLHACSKIFYTLFQIAFLLLVSLKLKGFLVENCRSLFSSSLGRAVPAKCIFTNSSGECTVSVHNSPGFPSTYKTILQLLNNPFVRFLQLSQHDTSPRYSNSFAPCQTTPQPNGQQCFKTKTLLTVKLLTAAKQFTTLRDKGIII